MHVERKVNIIDEKKNQLSRFNAMAQDAVSTVTRSVQNLQSVNDLIDQTTEEIEEYERGLLEAKDGLMTTRRKNEKIIKNFKALMGDEE